VSYLIDRMTEAERWAAATFYLRLVARGVQIGLCDEPDRILVGPLHLLTDLDRSLLPSHKPAIMAILRREEALAMETAE
jgi:hypothetical protein